MHRALAILLALALAACASRTVPPPAPQPPPAAPQAQSAATPAPSTLAAKTARMQKIDVFVPLYWDAENGKLLMELSRFGEEMIYQVSLPAGVGSNPIGLDRGELGATHIVRFDRIGPRVLMIEPNYRYRAISSDANERRAVEDSFARAVLASFKVESSEGVSVLVDATDFFLSDAHGVVQRLRATQQGNWSLDRNRSAIFLDRTKAFPRNTEVEAILTFAVNDRPGQLVAGVTPVP
ncbi:MAG: Glutamyl- and glutaminyl-tRNA synthetase, partial [Acidobacteria bacterium]|nr:Glutamyl- and glutaminyl-tRNA synthetase [Acidobacteriota bacterium]